MTPQEMAAMAQQCKPYTQEEKLREMHRVIHGSNSLTDKAQPEIPQQMRELDDTISVIRERVELLRNKLQSVLRQEPTSPPREEQKECLSTSLGADVHRLNRRSIEISEELTNIIRQIEL